MTENPVRCKYACARALLRMPISKGRRISHGLQKSIAFAGLLFLWKKGITLCYVENRSGPFFASISKGDPDPLCSYMYTLTFKVQVRDNVPLCSYMYTLTFKVQVRE